MQRLDIEPFTTITPIPTRGSVAPATGGTFGPKMFTVGRPSLGFDNYIYYCGSDCIGRIKVGSDAVDSSFVVNDNGTFDLIPVPAGLATAPTGDVFAVNSGTNLDWIVKLPFGESAAQKIMLPEAPYTRLGGQRASIAASPFMQIEHGGEQRYGFYLVVTAPDGLIRVDFDVNGNQLGAPYKIQGSDAIPLLAPTDVFVSPQGDVFAPDALRNSVIWLLSGSPDQVSEIAFPGNSSFVGDASAIIGDRDYLYLSSGDASGTTLARFGNPRVRAPYPTDISGVQPGSTFGIGCVSMGDAGQFYFGWADTLTLLSDAGHARAQTLTLEEVMQFIGQSGYSPWIGIGSVPGPDLATDKRSYYGYAFNFTDLSILWMQ
jgi:hypothetical protein